MKAKREVRLIGVWVLFQRLRKLLIAALLYHNVKVSADDFTLIWFLTFLTNIKPYIDRLCFGTNIRIRDLTTIMGCATEIFA